MTEIYVSKAVGASDSNPGTQAQPYLTISKAASVVNPGDVVHVADGTYNETVTLTRSGSSSSRIRFLADTRYGAKIYPTSDVTRDQGIVSLGANYIDFEGFEIAPNSGAVYVRVGCDIFGQNIRFRYNTVRDINFTTTNTGSAIGIGGAGNVVDGCLIYHVGNDTLDHCIYHYDGSVCTVSNCIVGNVTGFGFTQWHSTSNATVVNNVFFNCGEGGVSIGAGESATISTGNIVANNICYSNGAYGIREFGNVSSSQYRNNLCNANGSGTLSLINGVQSGTITTSPSFVNYQANGSGDYHVQSGSPAIGAANATYVPVTDHTGATRTSPHDIGAYDFVAATTPGSISYVGAGTLTTGTFSSAITPPLPSGIQSGDLLCCFSYHRTTGGTNSVSSGWSTLDAVDTGPHYHKLYYRVATGSDSAPTITPSGALSGQPHLGVVLAYRGVSGVTPFGTPGTASANASAEDIGPIAAATASSTGGAVIVFGARNAGSAGGTTALLTGDGLTWVEAVDGESNIANYVSPFVIQHAIWTGSAPTLTAKTLDVTGGSAGAALGRMYLLNPTTASDISYVGRGEDRTGGDTWHMQGITIPTGVQNGDLLFLTAYMMNPGTMTITSGGTGWVDHSTSNASARLIKTWYRWADGTQTSVTISNTGTQVPQTLSDAWIVAFRGVDPTQPFGTHGADSFNASAANVGPIAAPTSLPSKGAVIIVGARNATRWTSVTDVTGDGLTWVDVYDQFGIDVSPYAISLVQSYAIWTTGAPSITAKTLVPVGGAAGLGAGKMFVLRAAGEPGVTERTITASADVAVAEIRTLAASADVVVEQPVGDVWAGTYVAGLDTGTLQPPLPGSLQNGDALIVVGYLRNAGTLSISAGWTQHSLVDTVQNGSSFYLQTWSAVYDGTQVAPTITINGGSTSPQTLTLAVVLAARDVGSAIFAAVDGADSFNATAATIGPAAAPATLPSDGAAIVIGIRNSTPWTGVAALTGDGLTWVELFDNATQTGGGLGTAMVVDYASWRGGAPALTAKTFTATGGANGPGMSKMLILNYSDVTTASVTSFADVVVSETKTITAAADVYVLTQTLTNSVVAAADVYVVVPEQRSVTALADVVVSAVIGARSIVAFAECVVAPAITSPDAPRSATAELSAENVDTAWLVLLTIDHPDLAGETIRVTSDGVPTISGGLVYSPFPFAVILPDDVEGRPPQAQLQIDNTTQEIIAVLRGLITPPTLSIMIVRSITPDVVEYGWYGLEWTASTYDKSMITGTLTMPDLTTEEFPFETFGQNWSGLFAG